VSGQNLLYCITLASGLYSPVLPYRRACKFLQAASHSALHVSHHMLNNIAAFSQTLVQQDAEQTHASFTCTCYVTVIVFVPWDDEATDRLVMSQWADSWRRMVCCRGENGSTTKEQREEVVGKVWHVHTTQHSACVPAETQQVHCSLLGLWHSDWDHTGSHWQGLGGIEILSLPSSWTTQVLQRQATGRVASVLWHSDWVDRHRGYTGCANKKQSLRKNSLSQLL